MKININLIVGLIFSTVMMSGLMTYQMLVSGKVLGESDMFLKTNSATVVGNKSLVPQIGFCNDLNRMVNQYCSPVAITPTVACKTGVNNFSVGMVCKSLPGTYLSGKYTCYDGFFGEVKSGQCESFAQLQALASNACAKRSSCTVGNTIPDIKK